jgi:hypothetical protein
LTRRRSSGPALSSVRNHADTHRPFDASEQQTGQHRGINEPRAVGTSVGLCRISIGLRPARTASRMDCGLQAAAASCLDCGLQFAAARARRLSHVHRRPSRPHRQHLFLAVRVDSAKSTAATCDAGGWLLMSRDSSGPHTAASPTAHSRSPAQRTPAQRRRHSHRRPAILRRDRHLCGRRRTRRSRKQRMPPDWSLVRAGCAISCGRPRYSRGVVARGGRIAIAFVASTSPRGGGRQRAAIAGT